jgi:DNA repair exonuclease SbcCD nuclease subunit
MKWLLFSDPQFDDQLTYSTPTATGRTSRLEDQIRCLKWAFEVAKQQMCRGLITMGDVFDDRTGLTLPVIDAVCSTYRQCFDEARNIDPAFRLVFLVGNHDAYLRNARITSLRMFESFADVVSEPTCIGKFELVPWDDDREKYVADLQEAAKNTSAQFLMSHGLIKGSVADPNVGYDLSVFQPKRWKGVWMGDVHGPCSMAPNVHYIGAPMQHHFGDAGGSRGVVVLDDNSGLFKRVENTASPRFHIVRTVEDYEALDASSLSKDFIRVEIPDPQASALVAADARTHCPWVEAPAAMVEGEAFIPRLNLTDALTDHDVLAQYCAYKGVEDPRYLAMGRSLLEGVEQ